LALLVRSVRDLVFGRDRFCLRGGKSRTAWLGEVAERHQREAMTSLADFAVDLEAALQLCLVVHAERPGERPFDPRWRLRFLGAPPPSPGPAPASPHPPARPRPAPGRGSSSPAPSPPPPPPYHRSGAAAPLATAAAPGALRAMASLIDAGSGFGRSNKPSSGRMM